MAPIQSGVSPANTIILSKRNYEVRTEDGSRLLFTATAKMGERGIAQGILGLVRSGRGDYLIRLRKPDPSLGHHMAPKTTERPRDADRYIASDALVQHRGEQANGRIRSAFHEKRGPQKGYEGPITMKGPLPHVAHGGPIR